MAMKKNKKNKKKNRKRNTDFGGGRRWLGVGGWGVMEGRRIGGWR